MRPSSNRRGRGSTDSSATGSFRGDMQQWFRKDGAGRPLPPTPADGAASNGDGRRGGGANGRHRRAAGQVSAPLPEPTSLWGFTGRYGSGRESTPDAEAEARSTLAAGGWTPSAGVNGGPPLPAVRSSETTGGWRAAPDPAQLSGPVTMTGSWRTRAARDAIAEQRDREWDAAVTGQQSVVGATGSRPAATGQQRALPAGPTDWRSATGWENAPMVDPLDQSVPAPPQRPARRSTRESPADQWSGAVPDRRPPDASHEAIGQPTGSWTAGGQRAVPEPGYGPDFAADRHAPDPSYGPAVAQPTGSWDTAARRQAPAAGYGTDSIAQPTGSWTAAPADRHRPAAPYAGGGRPPGPGYGAEAVAQPTGSWDAYAAGSVGQPSGSWQTGGGRPSGPGYGAEAVAQPTGSWDAYAAGSVGQPSGSWQTGGGRPPAPGYGTDAVAQPSGSWGTVPAVRQPDAWQAGAGRRAAEPGYGAGSVAQPSGTWETGGRRRAPEPPYGQPAYGQPGYGAGAADSVAQPSGAWSVAAIQRRALAGSQPTGSVGQPTGSGDTGRPRPAAGAYGTGSVGEPTGVWRPDWSASGSRQYDTSASGSHAIVDSVGSWRTDPETGRRAWDSGRAAEPAPAAADPVAERLAAEPEPGSWQAALGLGSWQAQPAVQQPSSGGRPYDTGATGSWPAQRSTGADPYETASWRARPEPEGSYRPSTSDTGSWPARPALDGRSSTSDTGSWQGGGSESSGRHAVVESTGTWRALPAAGSVARQLAAGREAAGQARQRPARPASTQLALPAPRQPTERQPAQRDWRQDTAGTGEWPTTEWTRAGRARAEWRATEAPRRGQPAGTPSSPRATPGTALEPVRKATPAAGALPRLLGSVRPDGRPVALAEHVRAYGRLPEVDEDRASDVLLRLVEQSGLRGRGGAGYPVAKKMQAVLAARGKPIVVVNGAAGDPASEKDAFLITRVPHLILDGAQVAAQAVGAKQVLVYVVARPRVFGVMERAVAERRRAEVDAVPVRLLPAPDTYVAGESSAVAQHLSGGPALPMFHPPHTAERGVKGRPTLVQNVETLANLALLARYGASWFRGIGTEEEPGSLVLTVRGAVPRPVVIEVPVGTTIEQAIAGAGGATESVGALLVGGCMGRWLPAATALAAPLSHAGMSAAGGVLGANVIFALPDRACGLHETARLVRYLAAESAGQCGACLNGLPAIATALTELAESRADEATVQRLYRWCGMVAGRGACNHPDGVVALVASALRVFADEGGRHLGGWCSRPVRSVLPLPSTADQPAALAPNRPVRAPGRPEQEPLGWDEERYGPWATGPQQLALTSGRRAR